MNELEFFEELKLYLEKKDFVSLRAALADINEVDVAQFMETLPAEQAIVIFRMLPKEAAADIFSEFTPDMQQAVIGAITDEELRAIMDDLYVDDAVDMLEELPAIVVKRVLKNAGPESRTLINQFLKYPEDSVGSIMTAEFTDLRKTMTVAEAIAHIRRTGEDRETIYTCFVIDARRMLEGVISVKDLLFAGDEELVMNLMSTHIISAVTTDGREEVSRLFSRYDLLSVPVVDKEGRLVGIVTVDDAVDVLVEETTEDIERMGALLPSERPYLKTSIFLLAKNRIVWLLVLMISAMLTGGILGRYEAAFAAMPLLVTFIPMITDTGGNAGSQSSTLIIRGMAVGEIAMRDFFRVLWKELRVSLLVGAVLAAVNFIRLVITYPGNTAVALTVALALLITVLIAKTIGGVLPMAAKLIHADPAIMAAPLITTIVDALSLMVYFSFAQSILKL